jgi:predicted membrane channel-forming protein YqfA (hemolysin III family)
MGYDYTQSERLLMALFTGLSNIASLPVIHHLHTKKRFLETYIGTFTAITSFMYHVCESLEIELYMDQGQWHELDNIGSISCMNALLIGLTSSGKPFDSAYSTHIKLNFISMLITITMQTKHPWDLFNTIVPIVLFVFVVVYDYYRNGLPTINQNALKKGLSVLVIAVSMFIKGLDDENDYLRIYHSLWHVFIAISSHYIWQFQDKKVVDYTEEVGLLRNNIF